MQIYHLRNWLIEFVIVIMGYSANSKYNYTNFIYFADPKLIGRNIGESLERMQIYALRLSMVAEGRVLVIVPYSYNNNNNTSIKIKSYRNLTVQCIQTDEEIIESAHIPIQSDMPYKCPTKVRATQNLKTKRKRNRKQRQADPKFSLSSALFPSML